MPHFNQVVVVWHLGEVNGVSPSTPEVRIHRTALLFAQLRWNDGLGVTVAVDTPGESMGWMPPSRLF